VNRESSRPPIEIVGQRAQRLRILAEAERKVALIADQPTHTLATTPRPRTTLVIVIDNEVSYPRCPAGSYALVSRRHDIGATTDACRIVEQRSHHLERDVMHPKPADNLPNRLGASVAHVLP
jgi:hypothetical protein